MRGAIGRLSTAWVLAAALGARAQPPSGAGDAPSPPAKGSPAPAESAGAHAERARELEAVGRTAAAAREYEAAYALGHQPEMLYRLALCRRALREYQAAREALHGYLREAPQGPLAQEAERQLAQLAVLIEARGLEPPASAHAPRPRPERARTTAASPAARPAPGSTATTATAANAANAAPGPGGIVSDQHQGAAAPGESASDAAPAPTLSASAPSTSGPSSSGPSTSGTSSPAASSPAAAGPPPSAAVLAPASSIPAAPPASLAAAPTASLPAAAPALVEPSPAHGSRAAPWLAGGALLLGAGGAVLCVGAHEISADLDARYRAGALTAGDLPRYSKARAEGIAGTALIGAAIVALGAAAVLAW